MKKLLSIIASFILLCPLVSWDFLELSEIELVKYYWPINLIIDMHFEIGQWEKSNDNFSYYVNLLREISQYAEFDVVSYIKSSIDIEQSLQYVLDHLFQLIGRSDIALTNIDRNMFMLNQQKNECDSAKTLSDKNYVLALKDFNANDMEKYLSASIESEHCSSDARIHYNAYKKISEQISYYRDILKMKYDYFLEHKYDIVQNMVNRVK